MTQSLWRGTVGKTNYPRLEQANLHVDVAIVGGGITGVTAAYLIKAAGKRVALLEARVLGSGVTGDTTSHLTEVIDTRYTAIESKFGKEGARLVARSSRDAIELVASLDAKLNLRAELDWVPGYLYTEHKEQLESLREEEQAARRAGLAVESGDVPAPFRVEGGLVFRNQAQFHPMTYLLGLARHVDGGGSRIHEQTRVASVEEGEPCRVHLDHGMELTADRVLFATHAPISRVVLQTKVAHYRSYVVAGPVAEAPIGLFWDMDDPYHYTRRHAVGSGTYLISGGEDHKTGQKETTEECFERIAAYARRWGLAQAEFRWSGQVVEPVDGLPFIGRDAGAHLVHIATGFSGNGTTFGTLAAMMMRDACLGRHSPYADLYKPTRIKPLASLASFLEENIDFPVHLVTDRLRKTVDGVEAIEPGQGKLVRINGERMAVYRDDSGDLHALSPVCSHLGCYVAFNQAEKSWDCPCHGSRFAVDGSVLNGPAVRGLEPRPLVGRK